MKANTGGWASARRGPLATTWPMGALLAWASGSAHAGVPVTIASFQVLEPPLANGPEHGATQISADGSTVVGWSFNTIERQTSVRWRHGLSLIGEVLAMSSSDPFGDTIARAASADGDVVVGCWTHNEGGQEQAYRWVAPGPATTLPDLGILLGACAHDVTSDGLVVTGYALNPAEGFRREAMRWEASTGMVPLGVAAPVSGGNSIGLGISGNGITIVGETNTDNIGLCGLGYGSGLEGFDRGPIPTMTPRGEPESRFEGVCADASTFVGQRSFLDEFLFCQQVPARWRPATGWQTLPVPCPSSFAYGIAYDASADGSVVVGYYLCGDTFPEAFVWYEGDAFVRNLRAELESYGVTVGIQLVDAVGVSDDGTTIAGNALTASFSNRAFSATLPIPTGGGCVADVDDGTGTGTPDGGITIDDLIYYLVQFDAGNLAVADVDDGSGTGTPDGGVTIDDLIYFLTRFDAGC